jgi:hypothetical protein
MNAKTTWVREDFTKRPTEFGDYELVCGRETIVISDEGHGFLWEVFTATGPAEERGWQYIWPTAEEAEVEAIKALNSYPSWYALLALAAAFEILNTVLPYAEDAFGRIRREAFEQGQKEALMNSAAAMF